MTAPTLSLGTTLEHDANGDPSPTAVPSRHLTTHAVVTGMTGSGKTGLVMVLVEEALRARTPVLLIDVKGDLANLLLAFPSLEPAAFLPFLDAESAAREARSLDDEATHLATARAEGLARADIDAATLASFREHTAFRVITPGGGGGESLHVLSALEQANAQWRDDPDAARAALSASISLVLRLLGRDPDPARSRDHVMLSVLAELRLRDSRDASLESLLHDLREPPIDTIGALPLDEFIPKGERRSLGAALNALLASPTFASWRQGAPLDVARWFARTDDDKTPATIVSVAHLDDAERMLVIGIVLEEVNAWMRTQSGTQSLRALVVVDEANRHLAPNPAKPPTNRPIVSLVKQGRALGRGVVLATQDPMDFDYRALANAGLWFVGRLQTDADRDRVVDGMMSSGDAVADGLDAAVLNDTLKKLAARWFVMRDAKGGPPRLLNVRYAMSWLRGPMTARELRAASGGPASPCAVSVARDAESVGRAS